MPGEDFLTLVAADLYVFSSFIYFSYFKESIYGKEVMLDPFTLEFSHRPT